MGLIRLGLGRDTAEAPRQRDRRLRHALADTEGPIVVMVHGYKYDATDPVHSPHSGIFCPDHPEGWPVQLGLFGPSSGDPRGLAVAIDWPARGTLHAAWARTDRVGRDLAAALETLRRIAPARPCHVICHSMGAQVVARTLHHLVLPALDRVIVLTGAGFAAALEQALETPAGRSATLINVTSGENTLFDRAARHLLPAHSSDRRSDRRSIGTGIQAPNAVNLALDCPRTLAQLAQAGHPIAAPRRRICHWSCYTRSGAMRFYAAVLKHPQEWPLSRLTAVGSPAALLEPWLTRSLALFFVHIGGQNGKLPANENKHHHRKTKGFNLDPGIS